MILRRGPFVVLALLIISFAAPLRAQKPTKAGAGVTVDSLHVAARSTDSLLKADSILQAKILENARRLENSRQVATQREIDLTNDGKPETLRLSGLLAKNIDNTKLTFTIRSGKKLLYEDSWKAGGYFDPIDKLTDSVKLKRLRRIVTVFLANENFTVLDSNDFVGLVHEGGTADIPVGSALACQLFHEPRPMFSVFQSRELWYGLVWDPMRNRFVKAWRN